MKYLQGLYIVLLLTCCHTISFAQSPKLTHGIYQALNNYMEYSNEVVHAANVMHSDFEQLNLSFNQYIEQKKPVMMYKRLDVLNEYDYFPVLPKNLYQDIFDDNVYLPFDKRGTPLQLISKMHGVIEELDLLRKQLEEYITSGAYQQDSLLQNGYKWLRRAEVLYYDLFTLQEKIHWAVANLSTHYQRVPNHEPSFQVLGKLDMLITQSKAIIQTVRAEDFTKTLRSQCVEYNKLLDDLVKNKATYLAAIPANDTSAFCPHKRYEHITTRGRAFVLQALSYLNQRETRYGNRPHKSNYYFYNIDLLNEYNRYGDGMVAAFNQLTMTLGEWWLWECELPFIFEVIYPKIPAFAEFQKDTVQLDPEALAAQWKAKQDSIRKDSIQRANRPPQVGDRTLKGFATNNLIFLLDVSSSMNEPDKLPLLKESLRDLLSIMRPEDNITIITYSESAQVVLEATSAQNQEKILSVIDKLQSKSTSDADLGLTTAYETAVRSFIRGGNNRIIMATDGKFELRKKTRKTISKGVEDQLYLSVFYFSPKEFPQTKAILEEIATLGGGGYHYIQRDNAQKTLLIEAQAVRTNP